MVIYTHAMSGVEFPVGLVMSLQACFSSARASLSVRLKLVPSVLGNEIGGLASSDDPLSRIGSAAMRQLGDDTRQYRVLVLAPPQGLLASACKNDGLWGCSNGFVSAEYASPSEALATALHESLHLFGVDDCYDDLSEGKDPLPSCDKDDCVMRYGVVSDCICTCVGKQLRSFADGSS